MLKLIKCFKTCISFYFVIQFVPSMSVSTFSLQYNE